jgi:glycosyltransferase involved in cell wall biosynthesis
MKNNICVLLSTYNGKRFLKKQLDSLFSQTYKNFDLIVRDDGSTDDTLNILKQNNINYIKGNNIGVIKSFLSLIEYALQYNYEYFLLCDQDDIWYADKIEKQLNLMNIVNNNIPILIHSDMQIIDENDRIISDSFFNFSHLDYDKKAFSFFLVKNNVTGNSMFFNRKLAELIKYHKNILMHDWWIALIASAFGKIFFINEPLLQYRKHSKNVIGAQNFYSINKVKKIFNYSLDKIFLQAYAFKELYYNQLSLEKKDIIDNFINLKKQSFIEKRISLIKNKFFKQDFVRSVFLLWKI